MTLKLNWEDIDGNIYNIANLSKENTIYKLDIIEENLGSAIEKGCTGIGTINTKNHHYESEELFSFFKSRIPKQDDPKIQDILNKYNLIEYNEMELLQTTGGITINDRYFVSK